MTRLDVALIGAGFIARTHLPAWLALGARVRVYSTDRQAARLVRDGPSGGRPVGDGPLRSTQQPAQGPEQGPAKASAQLAAEFGATQASSLAEALDGATVVDICTPTATHRDIALAAFDAGAHVLCEKPLALTTRDAVAMTEAADRTGLRLYLGHVVRFFPAYVRLYEAVTEGALGRVGVARFTRTGRYPTWSPWFADPALSGGILTDQMLHDMDIARWLFGDVVRIHATQRGDLTAPAPDAAVAVGSAVLTHASGVISQVLGAWAPPSTPFHYTFHVAGSNGTLSHDSRRHPSLRLVGGRTEAAGVPTGDLGEDPFATQIREFAAAFQGGPAPRVSAHDGVAAVRIAEAARQSAATGRAVEVSTEPGTPCTEGGTR
jgi:predicted dehydrogenase